jgi:hypothetical protein
MRRVLAGSVISLVVVLQLASASLAQEASLSPSAPTAQGVPAGEPLPFADYVAALEAFTETSPFGAMSDPPTKDEVVAGFRNLAAMATAEQERLAAVVPEACYAEAHAELLAYWQSSIELTLQGADQLEAAAAVEEVGPIATALDEILFERHPIAYVELDDGSGGFEGSVFNILDALATCDGVDPAVDGASTPADPGSSEAPAASPAA